MRGHFNVFISDYSINQWGWSNLNDTYVIHHGLDTDVFQPSELQKGNHILSVVNDWKNRDWCCGYKSWTRITAGLPIKVLGDNPGLSKPASSTEELVGAYQSAKVFLNTSTISPVPMALMEAMSCGCAVVSAATCMIPEIIENGINGFISNNEHELRQYCEMLLKDDKLRKTLGDNARNTIVERFGLDRFIDNWNNIFDLAGETVFR